MAKKNLNNNKKYIIVAAIVVVVVIVVIAVFVNKNNGKYSNDGQNITTEDVTADGIISEQNEIGGTNQISFDELNK